MSFDKLIERVKKDLDIELKDCKRLYPGYWQRARGAFTWCAQTFNDSNSYGSTYSVSSLLKSKKPLVLTPNGEIIVDE